jgi:hypothetical protein
MISGHFLEDLEDDDEPQEPDEGAQEEAVLNDLEREDAIEQFKEQFA